MEDQALQEHGNGQGDASNQPDKEPVESTHLVNADEPCRIGPLSAVTPRKCYPTFSKPVLITCDDGSDYIVKGRQLGKAIVNDRVIGLLGKAMQAPVGEVLFVQVSQELIDMNPAMLGHLQAGLAHGCLFVPNVSERLGVTHFQETPNRTRFARLAVLYGLAQANDHQFFYSSAPANLVFSFDHGHFFPGGPQWTREALLAAPPPTIDTQIVAACRLLDHEVNDARELLRSVTDSVIVASITSIPEDWGITNDERGVLAQYLQDRRDLLLAGSQEP